MLDKDNQENVAQLFTSWSRALLVEQYLPKIERCLLELDENQIWWRPNAASNTVGNLILHLCGNVRQWIISGVGGEPDDRKRQREFDQTGDVGRDELLDRLRQTVTEAAVVIDGVNERVLLTNTFIQGKERGVLEAIYHVVEHFSMHTGQIILLTKQLSSRDLGFYDLSKGVPNSAFDVRERGQRTDS
jgi:uncharacterized damage-inducible protein DinB